MRSAPRYVILQLRNNGYRRYGGRSHATGLGYSNHTWRRDLKDAAVYDKPAALLAAKSIHGRVFIHPISRAKEIDRSMRVIWNT